MSQVPVQIKPFVIDGSGTSVPISFDSTPAVGNAVRIQWAHYGGNITTVADNQGGSNTYGADASVQHGTSANTRAFAFSCNNIAAASGTFTVTITTNSGDYLSGALIEEPGSLDSSPLDQSDTQESATTSITPTTPGATAQANEISYVIVSGADNGNNPHGYALPGDYTQTFKEDNAAAHMAGIGGYKILSATGVQAPTVTWTNNDLVVGIVLTYKAAAAATSILRQMLMQH